MAVYFLGLQCAEGLCECRDGYRPEGRICYQGMYSITTTSLVVILITLYMTRCTRGIIVVTLNTLYMENNEDFEEFSMV